YLLGHERLTTGRIGASKRELAKLKEIAWKQMKDGRPLMEDARFRDKVSRLSRAHRARDHEPALPRPAARRPRPGRRSIDAQDQGNRDPAGADRIDDAGARAARAAVPAARRRQRLRRIRGRAGPTPLQFPPPP